MLPPMKVIVIGSHATIGSEIVKALRPAHEVVEVNRNGGAIRADIRDVDSLKKMFAEAGKAGSCAPRAVPPGNHSINLPIRTSPTHSDTS